MADDDMHNQGMHRYMIDPCVVSETNWKTSDKHKKLKSPSTAAQLRAL
jgi:hypothetical protein